MFDLGFWEIVIILVIAVIFIKPKDIPLFLRNLGKLYRRLRDFSLDMRKMASDIESEIRGPMSTPEADSRSIMNLKEEVEPFGERESASDTVNGINETLTEKKDR